MTSSVSYIPLTVSSDIRFKQGRKHLKEKKYEEAIEMFVSLLETCIETYGEMSLESAVVHYEYGNTLLLKEEENPTDDLLGNVENDQSKSNDINQPEDEDLNEDVEENALPNEFNGNDTLEGVDENEERVDDDEEEPAEDLQIAWEVLDVARSYFAKEANANTNLFLSDIYMRLGDLMRFNSNISQCIEEYSSALAIREICCESHDSMLSDVHFSLAVAYVYNSAEKDTGVDPLEEKMKALAHYQKSRESILGWIEACKDTATEEEMLDKKELSDMLKETIDSLTLEIKEAQVSNSSCSSSSHIGSSTTTIGFGTSSSSSSSYIPSNSFTSSSFSATTSSSSSSGMPITVNPTVVNALQVKSKKRVLESQSSNVLPSVQSQEESSCQNAKK